jgi:hypothetical protein
MSNSPANEMRHRSLEGMAQLGSRLKRFNGAYKNITVLHLCNFSSLDVARTKLFN